jgi:hypothetical protein
MYLARSSVVVMVLGATIVSALSASPAHAQAASQPPAAQPQPPPAPLKFTGSATVGVSLESGRTDLNGVQVMFGGRRPRPGGSAVTMSFSYAYATTIAPGQPERATVANRLTASLDVEQNFRKHLVMMFRSQALRDPVAQLNYRFGEMAGFGVRLAGKRAHLRVVPGMALLNDDKNILKDEGFHVHYGLYEDLSVTVSPSWTLTQMLAGSQSISNTRDYILTFDAKLAGAITKHVGIQLSYEYNFERLQPPNVDPEYQKTTVGLQIRF